MAGVPLMSWNTPAGVIQFVGTCALEPGAHKRTGLGIQITGTDYMGGI